MSYSTDIINLLKLVLPDDLTTIIYSYYPNLDYARKLEFQGKWSAAFQHYESLVGDFDLFEKKGNVMTLQVQEIYYRFAFILLFGMNAVKVNYTKAIDILEKLTSENHILSKSLLAYCFRRPYGVRLNYGRGIKLAESKEDSYAALIMIGRERYSIPHKNYAFPGEVEHLEKLIQLGSLEDCRAQHFLGDWFLWLGKTTYINCCSGQENLADTTETEKAFYWYQKAALQGHVSAQHSLALMYAYEHKFRNIENTLYWVTKTLKQNHPKRDPTSYIRGNITLAELKNYEREVQLDETYRSLARK